MVGNRVYGYESLVLAVQPVATTAARASLSPTLFPPPPSLRRHTRYNHPLNSLTPPSLLPPSSSLAQAPESLVLQWLAVQPVTSTAATCLFGLHWRAAGGRRLRKKMASIAEVSETEEGTCLWLCLCKREWGARSVTTTAAARLFGRRAALEGCTGRLHWTAALDGCTGGLLGGGG
ncbi:unnamed protein product [Closterium sp. Naga37s-1]|nr:unnamed protein product [Closterium sp. Naga37s-1]